MDKLKAFLSFKDNQHWLIAVIIIFIVTAIGSSLLTYQYLEVWREEPEEPEPEPAIGFINLERLKDESELAAEFQKELDEQGQELEELYNAKGDGSATETYEQEQVYEQYEFKQSELGRQFSDLMKEAIGKLTDEYDLWLVVEADRVIAGGVDITDEVVEHLDDDLAEEAEIDEDESVESEE
ncbi:MAG: hypothetical protein ACOC1W_04635 [Bacillota bacterium]